MTVTLKDKIGQLLIVGFKGTELNPKNPIVQAILEKYISGVILFDYNFQTKTYQHNIKNPQQLQNLTQELQKYAQQAETLLPLLIGIDYEGGKVNRLKETYGFPKTLSAAEIGLGTDEQAVHYAQQMAKTLKDSGINLNFAPVLDINNNPTNPIIGKLDRSFSEDPKKISHFARIFSSVHQANKIISTYKHFPGHGSSTGDTHKGFVDITDTWKEYELEPYIELMRNQNSNNYFMIMTSHVVHRGLDSQGYPASLSERITTELLRKKLNFQGVVITDDLQMKAIADHYGLEETVVLAINAGADLLVFGNQLVAEPVDPKKIVDIIYRAIIMGKISENRIDESYQRITKLKNT